MSALMAFIILPFAPLSRDYVGTMSGLCRDYAGILSDRTSVLRRDYVGIASGLCRGYVGSQGKPR